MTELIELKRSNFDPNSVASEVFPDVLEGRLKHEKVFKQHLNLMPTLPQAAIRRLAALEVITLLDLLNTPSKLLQILTHPQQQHIKDQIFSYLSTQVAIGPEGYLIMAVFNTTPTPLIPQRYEVDRRMAIWKALHHQMISDVERAFIDRRFGLSTGLPLTPRQRAAEAGKLSIGRPHQQERRKDMAARALRKLRLPPIGIDLGLYAPLPGYALGRKLWGVNFGCELNLLFAPFDIRSIQVSDLNLSPNDLIEYRKQRFYGQYLASFPLARLIHVPEGQVPDNLRQQLPLAPEYLRSKRIFC